MNRSRASGSAATSQFQLIGGIRHDAGDCLLAVEPGGSMQSRKGALYLVTEPAGDPALGGEACGRVQATLAHEYYADPAPSVTTSLTTALNKANTGLISYNRAVLAAGDPPSGLPRKIRVGLSAAIVRPAGLYLCQLKPGLVVWVHGGAVSVYPRPATWARLPPPVNGDGEIVGTFYPAPALGTGPVVEADFAFRRFDSGDLLVLCSSNLAPLLDEDALAGALPGISAPDAISYLYNLAQAAGLPEAHALAVEMSTAPAPRRATNPITLPPPPDWAPEADLPLPADPAVTTYRPADSPSEDPAAIDEADPRIIPLRPRNRATQPLEPQSGDNGRLGAPAPVADEASTTAADSTTPAPPPVPSPLATVMDHARRFGRRAAPVVGTAGRATLDVAGTAGRATLDAAGTAGKATLGAAGTAGKATLGAAGAVLGATLPESVRQRGAAGMLHPDDAIEVEEDEAAAPEEEELGNRVVDFDAPAHAPAPVAPPFPWMRWLVPIAVVLLLGVLLFAVQSILAGQQTAKVDGLLTQAQQEEAEGHTGALADRRTHLLNAQEQVQRALDLDPRSSGARLLAARVQSQLDNLNGVTRLAGLTLVHDFSTSGAAPATPSVAATLEAGNSSPLSDTATLSDTLPLGDTAPVTGTLPAVLPTGGASAYYSHVTIHDGSAFLLNAESSQVVRLVMSTSQVTTLLAPNDQVELVGTAGEKARVGRLLFLAWRPTAEGGDLAALDDAQHAYIWTPPAGPWQAFTLGEADKLNRPRDLAAFDGNLYLLGAKAGQISKWSAGAYGNGPTDWLSVAASNEIRSRNPLALTVDGDIHVLLGDGRIVTLSGGEVKRTLALPVWPQIASPQAIFSTESTASIYVADKSEKRIIRVDKETGAVQGQLEAPADSSAFDGLRNLYVDEAAGKMYVLSGQKLFVATLPSLPTDSGTPVPALPAAGDTPTPLPAVTP
ncbi:MAG TPA: hypothetical protein VM536_10755 [Chloroflexia bacterium]|nr:hypothetical protein [Chloroflexia bacterium]